MATRKAASALVAVALLAYAPLFYASVRYTLDHADDVLINDVSRLNPTRVHAIVEGREVEALQEAVAAAREEGLKVSIAGKRHSMGGHAFYRDAVVLDMTAFSRVLAVDPAAKTITVESGATWADVIEAANPHGLAVGVMQAYNGFTVGGSLSVNVHESDPNYGPLVETVHSFRLLLANGTILDVSRAENPELFGLVIGGYGLFGVILEVTLQLTDDVVYQKHERVLRYDEYYDHFRERRNASAVGQIFARLSIAPDETLLREMVVTTYDVAEDQSAATRDLQAPSVVLKKLVFGLSRDFDWGKSFRWYLQRERSDLVDPPFVTRNNLMNGDVSFLDYRARGDTDILQEYFVPVDRLPEFVDDLRAVVEANDLNLLSATIRYVPVNTESVMSYSARESFGVVLYFNVGTSRAEQAEVERWTRELVDAALEKDGTFYLPYVTYASREQLREGYPNAEAFFAKKREHDPGLLFMNDFYDAYS